MLFKDIQYIDPISVGSILHDLGDMVALLGGINQQLATDRYSYFGVKPWAKLISKGTKVYFNNKLQSQSAHQIIQDMHNKYETEKVADLPAFQGGMIGCWYYDFANVLHGLPIKAATTGINGMWLWFDLLVIVDKHLKRTCIVATGYPELDSKARKQRAAQRLNWLEGLLSSNVRPKAKSLVTWQLSAELTAKEYQHKVQLAQAAIARGELFEVNFTQRFTGVTVNLGWDVLVNILATSSAPFAAYFKAGRQEIISVSPERLLQVTGNTIITQPIKGTAQLTGDESQDILLARALRFCPKQIAENTMIVDLVRNDLSKVALPGSIVVKKYCNLERFIYLQHLVSEVQGQLLSTKSALDAFAALFPAGSITGAPKHQAMQCIADLELQNRGAYCGAIGYWSHTGDFDSSVLIRTITKVGEHVCASAGGAVLLDSLPEVEYQEALLKASRLIKDYNA